MGVMRRMKRKRLRGCADEGMRGGRWWGVGEGKMKEALQEKGWEVKLARIFHL